LGDENSPVLEMKGRLICRKVSGGGAEMVEVMLDRSADEA